MKSKKIFEEFYFTGWFKHAVGNFEPSDLEISRRWFWGWLEEIDSIISVKNGVGKKALEIGCSIGGMASLLSDCGYNVTATDISKYAINKAKKLSPEIDFRVVDIQMPVKYLGKFDLVIALEVVEHLKNPMKAIVNMRNALKPNGILVFSSPYPYHWIYRDPTHISVHYPQVWLKFMKEAKLDNCQMHRFSILPFFYRFSRYLNIRFPFAIASPYINSPILFIGRRK